MGKPGIKSTKKLVTAETKARLDATFKWKNSVKGMASSTRDHIGRMIDRADPIEVAALFALTIVIRDLIQNTTELYDAFIAYSKLPIWITIKQSAGYFGQVIETYRGFIITKHDDLYKVFTSDGVFSYSSIDEAKADVDRIVLKTGIGPIPEDDLGIMLWLKSFAIAYLLIKAAGGVQSIAGFVGSALGLKTV